MLKLYDTHVLAFVYTLPVPVVGQLSIAGRRSRNLIILERYAPRVQDKMSTMNKDIVAGEDISARLSGNRSCTFAPTESALTEYICGIGST
jgi:hypothetical protein